MLPALQIVYRNRRHFEMFVGIFHLFTKTCFHVSMALDVEIFLHELDWHFISDVMSVSYGLMMLIHLASWPDENMNILLRYMAFALTLILKYRDGWDTAAWEVTLAVFAAFAVLARYNVPIQEHTLPRINKEFASLTGVAMAIGFTLFLMQETEILYSDDSWLSVVVGGVMNVIGGAGVYFGWQCVPVRKYKGDDFAPLPSSFT
ncbi:MAG: hypothetical protein SGCHY_003990 [Lobulomycetales sp.]